MPKKLAQVYEVSERQCKDCQIAFLYIARRIRCVDCYKKFTNHTKPVVEVEFIDDD